MKDHDWGSNKLPVDFESVQYLLLQQNAHKSMEPNGIHPRVLKELADVFTAPLSIIFQQSGSLERSPSTRSQQMSQFSRRARKKTLVITGLSVSLQCLVKLWRRLPWELLKNIWETMQSSVKASMGS